MKAWNPTVTPNRPTTATEYAKLAQDHRGYVVIGLPALSRVAEIGETLQQFAGADLDQFELLVTAPTDQKDWEDQVKLFQIRDPNGPKKRAVGRYFRCKLQRQEEA